MLITWEHFHRVKFGLRSNKSETYLRIWADLLWNFGLVEIANTYFPQVPKAGPTPGDYFDWRPQNASFSELGAFTKTLQGFDLLGDGSSSQCR